MSHADWRSPAGYEELRSLDAPGFAWEFLRRNPDFERERSNLERAARQGALNSADADAFGRRWGVQFRDVSADEHTQSGAVDSARPAERGPSHQGPREPRRS
jgi:hypothetical protein